MASPAHCFYCFEVLSASFERRDPPTLQKVLELYENYKTVRQSNGTTSTGEEESETGKDSVKVTDSEEEDQAGDEEEEEEEEDQEEEEDAAGEEETQRFDRRHSNKAGPQLPSISRLQASSSSSRSSSASSPSLFSASSSNSQLTTPSSTTSSSSSSYTRPTYASQLSATESYPLFVTWNTVARSGHKALRGCIGTFEALPLASGLSTYALTSAFDDTRFSPIPAALLPALSCSLTLLADFEPCQDAMDWVLGLHGLRISFNYRNRRHGATYLPDVAVEQGWTKEETVESLMKKAGWDGGYAGGHGVARRLLRGSIRGGGASDQQQQSQPPKPWEEVQDFKAIRYTGLKASASYSEWQDWRDWVEKNGLK
ncbi:uncharacterized protein Z520_10688 [Fonsecaea multimorphosa CBS 102226]|uniref:AMMECR1 domain-containing protein n=1 Tax=Fonsecaea multimorphosa CBS 102226 TaxID=1442371 RepID=A0A0D2GVB3_9EURO|nr:uncharacterized protein Z520_10688 [Fonsecaea multimorphosa CBS 102226]KIX93510.1 hypothetical protein Z520_10688 [Fonsecaea multimorphosa CBS 102226]OAL18826.1 hypothetical protein AYO22_10155 [Fonsecaea multimorphosa]